MAEIDISREALGLKDQNSKEPKEIKKVTTGKVSQKKDPVKKFLGGDLKDVGSYMANDVMIPAARNMAMDMVGVVLDILKQGAERMLYGESMDDRRRSRLGGRPSYISYGKASQGGNMRVITPRARQQFDFDEIVLENRTDAEEVLSQMNDLVDSYGVVHVSDLYDLVGITSQYTDRGWGWTDMRGSSVQATRNGYLINLPRPIPLTEK